MNVGTIPVLSDLVDALKWLVDFFVNKVPKPILFLIFLLFITIVGLLVSGMMHLVGIHCTSAKEVVKTDTMDFFNNARVIFASQDLLSQPSYNLSDIYPKLSYDDVIFYGKLNSSLGLWVACGENDTGCTYHLKHGACYNCTYADKCIAKTLFICGEYIQICTGDAYAWQRGSLQSKALCLFDYAPVPFNYAFNSTTGLYNCIASDYCGANATLIANTQLDDLLNSMGETAYYGTEATTHINRMVGIKCSGVQPTISFFGLEVLNFKVWVLMTVIYVLFIMLTQIGQQDRLNR
jgi:hypothetical protein